MKNRTKLPNIYIGVVTAVLYLPIVLVIIYSFNESKISSVWGGFSLKWYETLFRDAAMFEALGNSIVLALCASLGAAVIGTLGAYGFTKVQLRTKSAVEYVSMLPIMIPEIILGMVFMTFFALIGLPFGMTTLILAHTAFCVPYVYMLVKARLVGMDKSLAEAARDLGAGAKLLELAPNIRLIKDDNLQDDLISGEISAGVMYTSQVTMACLANPDLKVVYPSEGIGFGIMAQFVPVNAPNPDAAHAFIDYILRPEVSKQCFEYIGYYCTNQAADALIEDAYQSFLTLPEDFSADNMEMIQNISAEAMEAHTKVWTEFRTACGP